MHTGVRPSSRLGGDHRGSDAATEARKRKPGCGAGLLENPLLNLRGTRFVGGAHDRGGRLYRCQVSRAAMGLVGSSMTSITLVSTGISVTCLLSAVSGGRFFFALMPARRTLDFAFFGVTCFAANLRAGLAFAVLRFKLFLRAATRFFALAMAISCNMPPARSSQHQYRRSKRRCATVREMKEGPSRSAIRC